MTIGKYLIETKFNTTGGRGLGNEARFINYLCKTNSELRKITVTSVKRCYVYSTQLVKVGEEVLMIMDMKKIDQEIRTNLFFV